MVEVLLVNPPSPNKSTVYIRDINRSGRMSRERIIWPQTSLAYLAAMLCDNHSVKIIDCIAEEIDWPKFEEILKEEKPKYIITNAITSSLTNDLRVSDLSKEIGAKSIALGPHVTNLPEETLVKFPNLDFIVRGEAEVTIKELIDALENNGKLENVIGISYRSDGKIINNKDRPLIENLDELPIPRHDFLPLEKHVYPFIGSKFTFVLAGRGCPYLCSFCRQPIMWNRKVRVRSPDSVIRELKMLKELGVENFLIHSDTFTVNKEIVIELCKKIIENNLDFKWACNSRVDTVDKEMLEWMKKAGCWMVAYGIESGSQGVLDNVKKGITLEQSRKAVQLAIEAGIKVYGYFVIGLPGETKETIRDTIEFAKGLPLTFAIFHVAVPYPGTDFYFEAKEKGWLSFSEWEEFDQSSSTTVNYPGLAKEEIVQGVKIAYKEWYLRPKTIFNIFREIKNFYDLKHFIRLCLDHIGWI